MKQKIFIWFVSALVIITSLSSQSLLKQKPKTLFWGLIKIDKEGEYEEGYCVKNLMNLFFEVK